MLPQSLVSETSYSNYSVPKVSGILGVYVMYLLSNAL
jgi:hypothetical protein